MRRLPARGSGRAASRRMVAAPHAESFNRLVDMAPTA